MIDFAMISAPREQETIDKSISSFREAGFDGHINIFREPGECDLDVENASLIKNSSKFGAFKNHHQALTYLALNEKNNRHLCVLLDDMAYDPQAAKVILPVLNNSSVHCLVTIKQDIPLRRQNNKGWIRINPGWGGWGGLFVMPNHIALKVIKHPFYINHLNNYAPNKQIDACLYEVFRRMGIPVFVHNPSLADHIGYTSTIGHGELTEDRRGYNFRHR